MVVQLEYHSQSLSFKQLVSISKGAGKYYACYQRLQHTFKVDHIYICVKFTMEFNYQALWLIKCLVLLYT